MLNEALRLMRVFHDLSQKELAEKLEISKSHLSEIESGKKIPSLALLEKYSQVFDIPLSSILFFSENLAKTQNGEKARKFISSRILKIMNFVVEKSNHNYAD